MTRFAGIGFIIAILTVSTALHAQEQLPKTLDGTWSGRFGPRHLPFSGPMSVTIEKQNSDGSIEGKMTFLGGRNCEANDTPINGQFDGQTLSLQVTFRNKFQNAGCGSTTFIIKKGADGHFDGGIPGNVDEFKVSLAPK